MNSNWKNITTEDEVLKIIEASHKIPQLIFKHSTRCSISHMALEKVETTWDVSDQEIQVNFLDLITYRNVSNKIAEVLNVWHQSPQVILVKDGKAIFDTSHHAIETDKIKSALLKAV